MQTCRCCLFVRFASDNRTLAVANAICFDFDFPYLLQHAASTTRNCSPESHCGTRAHRSIMNVMFNTFHTLDSSCADTCWRHYVRYFQAKADLVVGPSWYWASIGNNIWVRARACVCTRCCCPAPFRDDPFVCIPTAAGRRKDL